MFKISLTLEQLHKYNCKQKSIVIKLSICDE